MAAGTIKIEFNLRPCIVGQQRALFHCWEQRSRESCYFSEDEGFCKALINVNCDPSTCSFTKRKNNSYRSATTRLTCAG